MRCRGCRCRVDLDDWCDECGCCLECCECDEALFDPDELGLDPERTDVRYWDDEDASLP
jgi:hypothetical protein